MNIKVTIRAYENDNSYDHYQQEVEIKNSDSRRDHVVVDGKVYSATDLIKAINAVRDEQ